MEFKAILFLLNKYGSIVSMVVETDTGLPHLYFLTCSTSFGEINAVLQNSFDVEVVVLVVGQKVKLMLMNSTS